MAKERKVQINAENAEKLHSALSDIYSDLGTIEEFNEKLQDPEKRKMLYDMASEDFGDLGTYEEYESKLIIPEEEPSFLGSLVDKAKSFFTDDDSKKKVDTEEEESPEEEPSTSLPEEKRSGMYRRDHGIRHVEEDAIGVGAGAFVYGASEEELKETQRRQQAAAEQAAKRQEYIIGESASKDLQDEYIKDQYKKQASRAMSEGKTIYTLRRERENESANQFLEPQDKKIYTEKAALSDLMEQKRLVAESDVADEIKKKQLDALNKKLEFHKYRMNEFREDKIEFVDGKIAELEDKLKLTGIKGWAQNMMDLQTDEKWREELAYWKNQRDGFFMSPEEALQKVENSGEPIPQSESVPASVRLNELYHGWIEEIYDIAENNGKVQRAISRGLDPESFGVTLGRWTEAYADDPEWERFAHLMTLVEDLSPVVLVNADPYAQAYKDNMMIGVLRGWTNAFSDDGAPSTYLESQQKWMQPLMAGRMVPEVKNWEQIQASGKYDPEKGFDYYGLNDLEFYGPTIGTSIGIGAQMYVTGAAGGAIAANLRWIPQTAKYAKYIESSKPLADLINRSKYGRYLDKTRYGKTLITRGTNAFYEGLKYEATGTLFPSMEEELYFGAGIWGSVGRGGMELVGKPFSALWKQNRGALGLLNKMFGDKYDDAKNAVVKWGSRIYKTNGNAMGEVSEEFAQEMSNIWRSSKDNQEFIKNTLDFLGDNRRLGELAVSSYIMGLGFGTGSLIGNQQMEMSQNYLNQLKKDDPAAAEKLEKVMGEIREDFKYALDESVKAPNSAVYSIDGQEVTKEEIISKIEAAKTFEDLAGIDIQNDKQAEKALMDKAKPLFDTYNKKTGKPEPTEPTLSPEEEQQMRMQEKEEKRKRTAEEVEADQEAAQVEAYNEAEEEAQAQRIADNMLKAEETKKEASAIIDKVTEAGTEEQIQKEIELGRKAGVTDIEVLETKEDLSKRWQEDEGEPAPEGASAFYDPAKKKIVTTKESARGDIVHEQAHAIIDMLSDNNQETYNELKEKVLDDPRLAAFKKIVEDNYEDAMDEDVLFDEMFAFLTQSEGINELNKLDAETQKTIIDTLREYLVQALQAVGMIPKSIDPKTIDFAINMDTIQDPVQLSRTLAQALTSGKQVQVKVNQQEAAEQAKKARAKKIRDNEKETGKAFAKFFSDVSTGQRVFSDIPYKPAYDLNERSGAGEFVKKYVTHKGFFDEHIAKSIPSHRETQVATGAAIVNIEKDADVVDIGGSDNSWAKTVTDASGGNVRTLTVDPNPDMKAYSDKRSKVDGNEYVEEAFIEGWTEDDGSVVPAWEPKKKYDVAHESMVFQFINNDRDQQIGYIKNNVLKPDGVLLTEEKVFNPNWGFNELIKDNYKAQYFTAEELEKKKKEILQGKGDQAEGMNNLMVEQHELERVLEENFSHVGQYWSSGNFVGYVATDSKEKFDKYMNELSGLPTGDEVVRNVLGQIDPKKVEELNELAVAYTAGPKIKEFNENAALEDGMTMNSNFTQFDDEAFKDQHGSYPDIVTLASKNFRASELTAKDVADFAAQYPSLMNQPNVTIGIFKEGDLASVDINVAIPFKHHTNSIKFAGDNNQIAIWSNQLMRDADNGLVMTGGNGETILTDEADMIDAANRIARGLPYDFTGKKKIRAKKGLNVPVVEAVQTTGLYSGEETANFKGSGQNGKIKLEDVADFFEAFTNQAMGKVTQDDLKVEDKALNAFARAVQSGVHEISHQMLHASDSGMDWYTNDMQNAMNKFIQIEESLKTPENEKLFKVLLAVTSNGNNPIQNSVKGFRIYKKWKETGRFPRKNYASLALHVSDSQMDAFGGGQGKYKRVDLSDVTTTDTEYIGFDGKKKVTIPKDRVVKAEEKAWSMRGGYDSQFEFIEQLIKDTGSLKAAMDWWTDFHPAREVQKYNFNSVMDDLGRNKNTIPESTMLRGGYALGPKIGPYSLNLMGVQDPITIDVWLTRTWGRWMGDMYTPRGELKAAPTAADRGMLNQVFNTLSGVFNLKPSELQAILWYYEQQLWTKMGLKSASLSYTDGANEVLKKIGHEPIEDISDYEAARERGEATASSAIARLADARVREAEVRVRDGRTITDQKKVRWSKLDKKKNEKEGLKETTSQTAERVLLDVTGRYTPLKEDIFERKSMYMHEVQNIEQAKARIDDMDLDTVLQDFTRSAGYLTKDGEVRNDTVLLGLKAMDAALISGDHDLARDIFQQLTAIGTVTGQLLRQYQELNTISPVTLTRVIELELQKHGLTMTEEQHHHFFNRSVKLTELSRLVNEAYKSYMETPDKEIADTYNDAVGKLHKEHNALAHDINGIIPKGLTNLGEQIIQGAALTPKSLIINPASNVAHSIIRFGENFMGSFIDASIKFFKTGRWNWPIMQATVKGTGAMFTSVPDAFKKVFTADDRFGEQDKFDIKGTYIDSFNRLADQFAVTFRPNSDAAKRAKLRTPRSKWVTIKTKTGKTYKGVIIQSNENGLVLKAKNGKDLFFEHKEIAEKIYKTPAKVSAERFIETFLPQAWLADAMFRGLILGDHSFRKSAETAEAARIYFGSDMFKNKTKDGFKLFLANPPKDFKERIRRAGSEAVFAEPRTLAKWVALFDKISDQAIDNALGKDAAVTAPLRAMTKWLKRAALLFKTVPANIVQLSMEYALPPLALAGAASKYAQGKTQEGSRLLARSMMGGMFYALGNFLYTAGVLAITSFGDDEEERDIELANKPSDGINTTALLRLHAGDPLWNENRKGDEWRDIGSLGELGFFLGYYGSYMDELKKSGAQYDTYMGVPMDLGAASMGAMSVLDAGLNQEFLKGVHTITQALSKKDPTYLADIVSTIGFAYAPNFLQQIVKSDRAYHMKKPNKGFWDRLNANFHVMTRNKFTDEVTPLVNVWGQLIPVTPDDKNAYFHNAIDIFKTKKVDDMVSVEISDLWDVKTETEGAALLTPPSEIVSLDGFTFPSGAIDNLQIKADPIDYTIVQTYAGARKRQLVEQVMNMPQWKDNEWSKSIKWDIVNSINKNANQEATEYLKAMINARYRIGSIEIDHEKKRYEYVDKREFGTDAILQTLEASGKDMSKVPDIEEIYSNELSNDRSFVMQNRTNK